MNRKETRLFQKITSLGTISDVNVDKLFAIASRREIHKGDILLKEGQICTAIYFIEHGYLRFFTQKEGDEINTDFLFENHFATDLKSLRSSTPSEITVQAGEDTVLFELDKNKLLSLYKESAEIESFGRNLLEELLIRQEEHSNLFKLFTPLERYRYLETKRPEIIQRVSLSQISSYLGVARETLSRIRKQK